MPLLAALQLLLELWRALLVASQRLHGHPELIHVGAVDVDEVGVRLQEGGGR